MSNESSGEYHSHGDSESSIETVKTEDRDKVSIAAGNVSKI